MKKLNKALRVLAWVLSSFIFISAALLILALCMGMRVYCIQTGSMSPDYPVGMVVFVSPAEQQDLAEGDVITFRAGSAVDTHRIVSADTENGVYTTKGDSNNAPDAAPVEYENVIGRVDFGIPYLGYPALLALTRVGKILLINAVLLIIVLNFIIRYFTENEEGPEDA